MNKKRFFIRDVNSKAHVSEEERAHLEKKQAEEYVMICRDDTCHPAVKRVKKAHHFMKWAVKLIVPDFLIGHPNLWDNLKTLRKHPHFKPLRMALLAWLFFTLTLGVVGIYSLKQAVRIWAVSPVTDTFTDETKISASTQITVDTSAGQVKLSLWSCGDTFTDPRDNNTYATVLIGSQCWMAENLNYGTMTVGANSQGSDCPSVAETEKYCYDDTEGNCTADGALYQWNQLMCGSAACNGTGAPPDDDCVTPVQGICPSGWHIPSHYEFNTLELAVCDSATCVTNFPYDISTTGWLGTNEGTKLRLGGTSGFEGQFPGFRLHDGSGFDGLGTGGNIWSSSEGPNTVNAWRHYLLLSDNRVYRASITKLYGLGVRCLRD